MIVAVRHGTKIISFRNLRRDEFNEVSIGSQLLG